MKPNCCGEQDPNPAVLHVLLFTQTADCIVAKYIIDSSTWTKKNTFRIKHPWSCDTMIDTVTRRTSYFLSQCLWATITLLPLPHQSYYLSFFRRSEGQHVFTKTSDAKQRVRLEIATCQLGVAWWARVIGRRCRLGGWRSCGSVGWRTIRGERNQRWGVQGEQIQCGRFSLSSAATLTCVWQSDALKVTEREREKKCHSVESGAAWM